MRVPSGERAKRIGCSFMVSCRTGQVPRSPPPLGIDELLRDREDLRLLSCARPFVGVAVTMKFAAGSDSAPARRRLRRGSRRPRRSPPADAAGRSAFEPPVGPNRAWGRRRQRCRSAIDDVAAGLHAAAGLASIAWTRRRRGGLLRGGQSQQPEARFGSVSDSWARDLSAGKLTTKLSHRTADVRGRQLSTQTGRSSFSKAARRSGQLLAGYASSKRSFMATRTRPSADRSQ
jgi:hypothetical protein